MVRGETFSREEGSAVQREGLESGRSGRTPGAMLSCRGWSLRQDAFAPNPIVKFTVHLLQTASPADNRIVFSREELRRRKPRHSLRRVTLLSSYFGLVHGSGKWHKEHALSNHAKSESSRVGRDWPVMSANRKLPLVCKRNLPKDRSHPISAISSDKSNVAPS